MLDWLAFFLEASLGQEPIDTPARPSKCPVSRTGEIGSDGMDAVGENCVRPLIAPGPRTNRKFNAFVFHA
jgi:hypothetical protein